MWAKIAERQPESDFTKCEIIRAHEQKIIALLFNDSYFARTCETGITFARTESESVNDFREMRVNEGMGVQRGSGGSRRVFERNCLTSSRIG
jgi:hypothetical protein